MSPRLRQAEPADHKRVADILIQTRSEFMPYAPPVHSEQEVRAWVENTLLPAGGTTVAEVDGCVAAVMAVSVRDGIGWVEQMAVAPELVGQGIGANLIKHALAVLPLPIRLYTFQQNVGARRFYERHGFRALEFTDGRTNEERCPDVLYEMK
ncbi:MAG: GNAT family N-acetyltransferase [Cytophagales bacterium]|nr:GNAT family N-acetyltransferase [Rhizobacter sp.]